MSCAIYYIKKPTTAKQKENKMNTSIKVRTHVTREQDIYKQGCVGEFQDLGCVETFTFCDMNDVKRNIDLENATVQDDSIYVQRYVNSDGIQASKSDFNKWQSGELSLWLETTSYYITHVTETDFTENELETLLIVRKGKDL